MKYRALETFTATFNGEPYLVLEDEVITVSVVVNGQFKGNMNGYGVFEGDINKLSKIPNNFIHLLT